MTKLKIFFNFLRLLPHVFLYKRSLKKDIIDYDVNRWSEINNMSGNRQFVTLMTNFPEFRNLFYNRIGKKSKFIEWLCPPLSTLIIYTKNIGPGLYIQHGIATIIGPKSIGKDCWINQQVSIGYTNATDTPTIGDNVTISAGAKVLGKVHMGNNSIAGANTVIVKDVPDNCVVVGIPAYIIRKDGKRVNEKL